MERNYGIAATRFNLGMQQCLSALRSACHSPIHSLQQSSPPTLLLSAFPKQQYLTASHSQHFPNSNTYGQSLTSSGSALRTETKSLSRAYSLSVSSTISNSHSSSHLFRQLFPWPTPLLLWIRRRVQSHQVVEQY